MKITRKILIIIYIILQYLCTNLNAQDTGNSLEGKLKTLVNIIPELEEKVTISVSNVSIQEFVRGIAKNTNLNVSVDPAIAINVTNNFKDVPVLDLFVFLCKQYQLDLEITGSIITVKKHQPLVDTTRFDKENLKIEYNNSKNLLSIDVKNEKLSNVAKKLIDKTEKNIILEPDIGEQNISVYLKNMPYDNAIESLSFSNSLVADKSTSGEYIIRKKENNQKKPQQQSLQSSTRRLDGAQSMLILPKTITNKITFDNEGRISLSVAGVPTEGLISYVSDSLGINYTFANEFKGNSNISADNLTYKEFLNNLLAGSEYTYSINNNVYIFAENQNSSLITSTRIIQIQNRTVEKMLESVPDVIMGELQIAESFELNSIIVSGEVEKIDRFERFILEIDKIIPVILIEILIVDITKSSVVTTGINAGFGENPDQPAQTILPGIDYGISTDMLNNIFKKFDGFGWINLGKVTPDFYLSLKALEDNGNLEIRSTPKLSTLNGHEAILTSGETKYYKEETSNYYGSESPALSNSYTWKAINADLSIRIKPIVSGDDQVTLDVEVQQSEFTPREFEDAPPGSVTRSFKSLIRIKNQEMVLLGGLDKITDQDTGQGLPFLSRIPIIKWLFSNRTKSNTDAKLNVFIQPTILF